MKGLGSILCSAFFWLSANAQPFVIGTDPVFAPGLVTLPSGPTNVTSGLVGWWKLDEGTGLVTYDSSGSNNTAGLTSGSTWVSGVMSNAIYFTGSQSATITNIDTLDALNSGNAWSLSIWFSNVSHTVYAMPFDIHGASIAYWGQTSSGTNFGILQNSVMVWATTNLPPTNGWTHIVATSSSAGGGNCTLYYNGISQSGSVVNHSFNQLQYKINESYGGATVGAFDDARAYNRALSYSEVTNLYSWRP